MATLANAEAREYKASEVRMEFGLTTYGRYSYLGTMYTTASEHMYLHLRLSIRRTEVFDGA